MTFERNENEMERERKMFEKHWQDFVAAPAFDPAETPLEIIGKAGQK
jgi:hypothetical protein